MNRTIATPGPLPDTTNAAAVGRGTTAKSATLQDAAVGRSAAAWPAIIAGAVSAAALSLALLLLGGGLGLGSIAFNDGASPAALGLASVLWLLLMSALASGLGGYLAGRLRTRWPGVDVDEVFFRDTAHGFLTWALATLIAATLLTSTVGAIFASTSSADGTEQVWEATAAPAADDYFVDKVLRSDRPGEVDPDYSVHMEVGQILSHALRSGELPVADRNYLVGLVANVADTDAADAEQRVTQVYEEARASEQQWQSATRDAADAASQRGAKLSLWLFVSLLVGAFCASYAATIGGRQRDRIADD